MTFANSALLVAGLACVALPILIHILMRRRRKPIAWGAMEWLMQAYRQQRRRTRLEQMLLLASRCLLVALVALALGKPLLGALSGGGLRRAKTLSIVIDNSLASQATNFVSGVGGGSGTSALESLKARAVKLVDALHAAKGDRCALVLMGSPAQTLVVPASADLAEVKRQISQVQVTDTAADLPGAIEVLRGAIAADAMAASSSSGAGGDFASRESDHVVAILSESREGSVAITQPLPSLAAAISAATQTPQVNLQVMASAPAQSLIANTSIVGIEPLSALVLAEASGAGASAGAASVPIRVSLARSGDNTEQAATVRVWLASASKATRNAPADTDSGLAKATVSWKPGQRTATVTVSPSVSAGNQPSDLVVIARIDDDAIAGDNIASRPLEAKSSLQVALVGPGNETTGSALDRFTPRDWFALSLSPEQSFGAESTLSTGGVRVSRLEARDFVGSTATDGTLPGFLRGTSAIVITEPQLLDPGAWRILRNAAALGVAIIVTPPEQEQSQTWADSMTQALGTTWVLSRTVRTIDAASEAGTLTAETQAQGEDDLLSLVRSELEELVRPIHAMKIVPIESGLSKSQVLLSLRDGSPLVVASRANIPGVASAGWVVLWLAAPSLAWTDLPAKPLMVPLSQELVRQAVGRSARRRDVFAGAIAAGGGQGGSAQVVDYSPAVVWQERQNSAQLIPVARLGAGADKVTAIRNAGVYLARNDQGVVLHPLSVNAPGAAGAGNTTPVSQEQVASWLAGIGGTGKVEFLTDASADGSTAGASGSEASTPKTLADSQSSGWKWSFWLLVAAGVIAAIEAVLARVFSHATVRGDGGGQPQGVVS